jgi:hypothetical protein
MTGGSVTGRRCLEDFEIQEVKGRKDGILGWSIYLI